MLNMKELEAFLKIDQKTIYPATLRNHRKGLRLGFQLSRMSLLKETRDIRTREEYGREGIEASGG